MPDDAPIDVIVDALARHNVDYVLIGGAAMMLHGCAYTTDDIDICYQRNPENITRLVTALKPFKPRLRLASGETVPFIWDTRSILNGQNFTLSTDVGDVDILGTVTGLGAFDTLRGHAETFRVGDRIIPMLTISGLIIAKRAAGRAKDLLALPELEVMLEAALQIHAEPE